MNYTDLNKTQRRCIDAFIKLHPHLASKISITRPEVEEIFFTLLAERANGGPKIGYPTWLTKYDRIARGVYDFPSPDAKFHIGVLPIDSIDSLPIKKIDVSNEEDVEFFTDLKEYGLIETV